MKLDQRHLMAIWERALAAEIGIAIESDNGKHLRAILYKARAASKRQDLKSISIYLTASNKVMLVKQTTSLGLEEQVDTKLKNLGVMK